MCLNSFIFTYANQKKEPEIKNIPINNIELENVNLEYFYQDDIVSEDGFVFDTSTGTIIDCYNDSMLSTGAALFIPNEIAGIRVDAIGDNVFNHFYKLTSRRSYSYRKQGFLWLF